jgi:hypothetical protein
MAHGNLAQSADTARPAHLRRRLAPTRQQKFTPDTRPRHHVAAANPTRPVALADTAPQVPPPASLRPPRWPAPALRVDQRVTFVGSVGDKKSGYFRLQSVHGGVGCVSWVGVGLYSIAAERRLLVMGARAACDSYLRKFYELRGQLAFDSLFGCCWR